MRTVAAETPRPVVLVTVCEPTGWAVSTYCSTIARSTAALRSSSSVISVFPCRRWHSIVPSASRVGGRRAARAGRATGSRRRPREQAGGTGPEARSRPRRVRTIRSPIASSRPAPARSATTCAARSAATAPGCAARERTPLRRASRDRGPRRRRLRRSHPRSRRCTARACARSTTGGRPCGRARRNRSRGSRRRSSTARCAGTLRPAAPSSTPRTTRVPRREHRVGTHVGVGLQVVVGRRRAGGHLPAERGRGFDGERVRAHVVDAKRERAVERSLPVVGRLSGRAVDEIDIEPREPRGASQLDRARHVRRIVRAPERGEDVRHHRLHAEAQPIDSGPAVRGELGGVDTVGVALDGDLGAVGSVDGIEDPRQLRARRSVTACPRRRRRSSRPAARRLAGGRCR